MDIGFKEFHGVLTTPPISEESTDRMQIGSTSDLGDRTISLVKVGMDLITVKSKGGATEDEIKSDTIDLINKSEVNIYNKDEVLEPVAKSINDRLVSMFSGTNVVVDCVYNGGFSSYIDLTVYTPSNATRSTWRNNDMIAKLILHGPDYYTSVALKELSFEKISVSKELRYRKIKANSLAELEKKTVAWFDKNKNKFVG